jgi:hypothetical protein
VDHGSSPTRFTTLVSLEASATSPRDDDTSRSSQKLMRGRFEALFETPEAARGAARDARAVGFEVDVRQHTTGWLIVCRRRLPFFADDRDRYASRIQAIAKQNGGAFTTFVDEADTPKPTGGRG